jgi:molybdate transport system ATP-binding protein
MSPPAERIQVLARKRLDAFDFHCDIDLPVAGLTALFGASGAGKSTLLNLVAGLSRPDEGRIAVGSRVFFDRSTGVEVPVEQRELGFVFQDARLFPHLTARQNLMYGLRRAGRRAQALRATPDAVIELLGLAPVLERRPHTLSGGERQRVAIGRALLAQPRLLLMDEPLASLDAPRKAEVLTYIERLRDEFDVPILYVTHAVDEVLRLARTLVVLHRGAIVAAGPIDDVLQEPAVARLFPAIEAASLLHCRVRGHDERYGLTALEVDAGVTLRVPRIDLAPGTSVRVRIPARDVALALSQPVDVSTVNRLPGTVIALDPLDATHVDARVRIGGGVPLHARVTRESTERLGLIVGLPVWCLIKSVALDRATLLMAPEPPAASSSAIGPAPAAANDASVGLPR